MKIPAATYRLQFRNGMTFSRAAELAPYFARLGISHVYGSPIFQAEPNSTHGYDVTDTRLLDTNLGGEPAFEHMIAAFGRLDICVPNSGIQLNARIDEMTLAQWQRVIDVNLTGQFLCAREAVREFKRRGVRPEVVAPPIDAMSLVDDEEVGTQAHQPFDFTFVANRKPFRSDVKELEGAIGQ